MSKNLLNETFTKHLGLMKQHLKLINEDVEAPNNLGYEKEGSGITITDCDPKSTGELIIPDKIDGLPVTSIGDHAFRECSGLTSVTLPSSITSIGKSAFSKCGGLTSVTLPSSLTSIGRFAFYECKGLTSLTIPDSVTSIGDTAFCDCRGLTQVKIGSGITSISDAAFSGCKGLTSVTFPSSPSSITSIGVAAFFGCRGLTSVTIPNSVTSIANNAFAHCTGLTSVTLPSSLTSIGNFAFKYSKGLTRVIIPNSVTSIGSEAFPEETKRIRKNSMNERASDFESVTGEFKVEVDLVGRPDTSIDVTVEGDWEETGGIGHYAYGDQKANDSSSGKYIEITSYDWDKTGYTPAEIKIVNKAIDDQLENWAEELTDRHY